MAEEKQLTVAELLARNAKEREGRGDKSGSAKGDADTASPRRRRRRSLDEGGVSVAELTGSIKRVEAEPARSRHSSTRDSPAPVIPAPKKSDKPEEPKPTDSKPADAKPADAKPAASAPKTGAGDKSGKKTPAADETTVIKKVDPSSKDNSEGASKGTAAKSAVAKPAGKPAGTKSDDTTVMPAQPSADKPSKSAGKSTSAAATGATAAGATAASGAGAATAGAAAKSAQATPAQAKPGAAKDVDSTGEIPVVGDEAHANSAQVTQHEDAVADDIESDVDESAEDHGKLSAVSIVVLALVGIIIGAIVFKGFEVLWGSFDRIIVSILALVVTGAMVGVVHALRTARDAVSMSMAGVVGLILTFGPLLIILL